MAEETTATVNNVNVAAPAGTGPAKPKIDVTYVWHDTSYRGGGLRAAWAWLTDDLWRLAALGMGVILLIAVANTITSAWAHGETGERVRCFKCLTQTNGIQMGRLTGVNTVTSSEVNPAGQTIPRVRTYLVYVCREGHIQMVERDAMVVDTAAVGK